MRTRLKSTLLFNLLSIIVIASLAAISLPFLYKQHTAAIEAEVNTALSLFEISARRAVNTQNKNILTDLAQQLLKSPSINYVKVTDQSSKQLMAEAGEARKSNQSDAQKTNKLAAQVDNQQRPASQINPVAWVEIEFATPSNVYYWLYPHRLALINLIIAILLIQLALSLIASSLLNKHKPPSKNDTKIQKEPSMGEQKPLVTSSKTALEMANTKLQKELTRTKSKHEKDKTKLKQLVELSSRANSLKQALLEHADNATFIVDEHNHIIESSPIGLAFLGVDKNKLIKISLNNYFHTVNNQDYEPADFMELLVSFPESFCMLASSKQNQQAYAATHVALPFNEDSLYLVSLSPIPEHKSDLASKQKREQRIEQLQLASLYTPLKAGCIEALNQLNNASQLAFSHTLNYQALDAQLRLSTLMKCLPWEQAHKADIALQARSILVELESHLLTFSPLYRSKSLSWSLVVSPEVKQQYFVNSEHLSAILHLQLYLVSLYPEGSQVLFQLTTEQEQLVFSIDSENAQALSELQQSIIGCSAALTKQVNARQQQSQDTLSLTFDFAALNDQVLFSAQDKPQTTQCVVALPDPFVQRCLSLQLQLLGAEVIEQAQYSQLDDSREVVYISTDDQLPTELDELNLNQIKTLQLLEDDSQIQQTNHSHLTCLRAKANSYLMATLSLEEESEEQQNLSDIAQAIIKAEDLELQTSRTDLSIASFSQSKHDFEELKTSQLQFNWQHRVWQEAYNQIKNLDQVDYLLIKAEDLNPKRIQQVKQRSQRPSLLVVTDTESNSALLAEQLQGVNYYPLVGPLTQQQLVNAIQLDQQFGQGFESICDDEQLLHTHQLSEFNYLSLIKSLSELNSNNLKGTDCATLTSKTGASLAQHSFKESYLNELYRVFTIETKNRASLINGYVGEQRWPEIQQHINHIACDAGKFSLAPLENSLNELNQACIQQNELAVKEALSSLVS
ncbi:PAS domain-containing protein [Agarivorans sp. DSG3-1]|uniref:PAS domain-containing protein n=1 Tax=Agarivorans sp. DSG3-1 TaxID=3342249 RepID=UPI00398EDFA5